MNLREQINKEYSVKNIENVATYIDENPQYLKELIDMMLFEDTRMSQKASWVLTKFTETLYFELIEYLDYIFKNLENGRHDAVYRSLSKTFKVLSSKKYISYLSDSQIDSIVEISFSKLIDENEKAAIRAFSMIAIKNLADKRPWVKEELVLYVENNMAGSLPSFQSCGRRVLKDLKKS